MRQFSALDVITDQYSARDQGPGQIPDFPYLRVNRLLASFADEINEDQFAAFEQQLAALDEQARSFERSNLPYAIRAQLPSAAGMNECRSRLLTVDQASAKRRLSIRNRAKVADDYLTSWRWFGLYPLTALIVRNAIADWHTEAHATFATPLALLPVHGALRRWSARYSGTLSAEETRALVDAARTELDIPRPQGEDLRHLFNGFAPTWEIDVVSDDDRIGAMVWSEGARVDLNAPSEYRLVSHTRINGRVLLQLNYVVWFPARSGNDLYAGRIDGLTFRVTLASDGTVLAYDSIHNCGCFLQFFPGPRLQLRGAGAQVYREEPLVPQDAPRQPVVIRLAHGTHFIERIYHDDEGQKALPLMPHDYDELRSLKTENGHHSLFGAHGIIPGTERCERFILWPMGIRSPGAMRQWGHHAVAFIGRRYFDDPYLLEELFTTEENHAPN